MQTQSIVLTTASLFLSFGVAMSLHSQNATPKPSEAERARHSLAINLLRAVNTAEYDYKSKHGGFAFKEVLLASEEFKGRGMAWAAKNDPQLASVALSSGPEIVPGWSLRLNLTADGEHYDVLLEDKTDKTCGYAAITNESGLIWQGKNIQCPI